MSVRCQQETHAPQQRTSLFNHLVGAGEATDKQSGRDPKKRPPQLAAASPYKTRARLLWNSYTISFTIGHSNLARRSRAHILSFWCGHERSSSKWQSKFIFPADVHLAAFDGRYICQDGRSDSDVPTELVSGRDAWPPSPSVYPHQRDLDFVSIWQSRQLTDCRMSSRGHTPVVPKHQHHRDHDHY